MARRAFLASVLALLVAWSGAAQQATPGQLAYLEGVRAFDAGDYATAASKMRVALAEDAREAPARFRNRAQNAEDYFPHFWLGLSLEKLGERDAALPALRESQRQGAVEARPALRRILSSALVRLTPPTPAPTLPPTPLPTEPVAQATPTPPAPVAPTPAIAPPPTRATVLSSPVPATVATVATVATPPAPSGAAIRAGTRAFFRGDYAGAERLLAPEAVRSPVARAFLAWSLGGRYLLGGGRDEALLSRARSEYAAALLAGGPATGEPWVSPAILALFGAGKGTP